MLMTYINKAMKMAVYELIEDDQTYYGEIPNFQGVWANHETLEGCRNDLNEALSDWIALRLSLGLELPIIDEINLNHINQPLISA